MNGDMPEIEKVTSDDTGADLEMTQEAAKAFLLRRFAWDIMPCPEVNDLLTALGLTHGSDEGQELDHRESHRRLGMVFPLEKILRPYAQVMGTVVSVAMLDSAGLDDEDVDSAAFAEQNAEVVLSATRAVLAQLMATDLISYGSNAYKLVEDEGMFDGQ